MNCNSFSNINATGDPGMTKRVCFCKQRHYLVPKTRVSVNDARVAAVYDADRDLGPFVLSCTQLLLLIHHATVSSGPFGSHRRASPVKHRQALPFCAAGNVVQMIHFALLQGRDPETDGKGGRSGGKTKRTLWTSWA